MYKLLLILLFPASLLFCNDTFGQEKIKKPQSIEKRKKELEKVDDNQDKEKEEAITANQERHMSIQSKDTRKRMRKSKKKAKKTNTGKKSFSFRRIIGK